MSKHRTCFQIFVVSPLFNGHRFWGINCFIEEGNFGKQISEAGGKMETRRGGGLKDWREGKCLEDWRIGGLKDWREGRQKVQMLGGLKD